MSRPLALCLHGPQQKETHKPPATRRSTKSRPPNRPPETSCDLFSGRSPFVIALPPPHTHRSRCCLTQATTSPLPTPELFSLVPQLSCVALSLSVRVRGSAALLAAAAKEPQPSLVPTAHPSCYTLDILCSHAALHHNRASPRARTQHKCASTTPDSWAGSSHYSSSTDQLTPPDGLTTTACLVAPAPPRLPTLRRFTNPPTHLHTHNFSPLTPFRFLLPPVLCASSVCARAPAVRPFDRLIDSLPYLSHLHPQCRRLCAASRMSRRDIPRWRSRSGMVCLCSLVPAAYFLLL